MIHKGENMVFVNKRPLAISVDKEAREALFAQPHLNKSAFLNDIIRQALIENGMLKDGSVEA